MSIKETLWLMFFLQVVCFVGLYFFLPWLKKVHQENKAYKLRILQDHAELGRMVKSRE